MSKDIKLKTGPGDVVIEFADDGIFVYSGCCGRRIDRDTAEQLKRRLKAWLKAHPDA